jgi:hypothetical protein
MLAAFGHCGDRAKPAQLTERSARRLGDCSLLANTRQKRMEGAMESGERAALEIMRVLV